jgi:lipopolysaccharide export LptBFGC system permease protein LptF
MVKLKNGLPEALVVARKAEVSVDLEEEVPELVFDFTDFNMMAKGQEENFMGTSQPIFFKSGQIGLKLPENTNEDVRDQPDNLSLRRLSQKIGDKGIEPEKRAAYRTELSTRFAFSVSCLIFGLIGVPLGITAQRRESTVGFVIALTIAITYYVLLITAQMYHTNEAVLPHLLVWVPNLLCFGLGLFLFWRLSRK